MQESIWNRTASLRPREPLSGDRKVDAAVIGGGLAGILTAHFLRAAGLETVVLEAARAGSGQTGRTTAKITAQHGLIYERLIDQLGREKAVLYAQANQWAVAEYRRMVREGGIDCDFTDCPAHLYATGDPWSIHREAEAAHSLGIDAACTADTELPFPVAAALPRICWDREWPALEQGLKKLQRLGVDQALCPTWDAVERALRLGLRARGDFGLNIFNSQALKQLRQVGLESAVVSFELKLPQIRDLSKAVDTEFIAYGRLPLMITENCIIHNHSGQHTCAGVNLLTDRKGERFPVMKAFGCRNEIFNAKKIFLADKQEDWQRLGLWAARLQFTTENALECAQVLERYLDRGKYQPNDYTRGLYYRGVE